jgi:hypothetical protein
MKFCGGIFLYAEMFKGHIVNFNIPIANRKGLNSEQALNVKPKGKRKKGMTLVQIDKRPDFSLNDALTQRFCRLQKDYRWIINHKKELRNEYPNQYVAVENESVRYVANTIEALMSSISRNNEQVDNFAIEYLSQYPTSLLF